MRQFTVETQSAYAKMWNAFQNGFITAEEWTMFATVMLDTVLRLNQPMLIRMKNNVMTHIKGNVDQ